MVAITVTDGGADYPEIPSVILAGGGGNGATASALLTSGAVSQIALLTPGSGYTNPPDVIISAPPAQGSVLAIQMVPLLMINGLPGDTNQIETATTSGAGAVWIPLTNVVLTSSVYEFYDRISPPGAGRFYRAVLLGSGGWLTPGPRFVWLPSGRFLMGSPEGELDRSSNEGPQTMVTLTRGFFMGRYEVTQGEYLSVIGSNPSGATGDLNRPVEQVTWNDATNYCAQLTQQERTLGRLPAAWGYRLPTEAEWEYACRAGSTNRFSYGNDPGYTQLGNYAWYFPNSSSTHAAGDKLPNRWGLYDMSGNVWEFCSDWFGDYLGGSVTDPRGPISGSWRVIRGGGYTDFGYDCRAAHRYAFGPADSYYGLGFRVVLAPIQP